MPSKQQFLTLFAYHWHLNERFLALAAQLNADDYNANPGYGHGSVHALLFHVMSTSCAWRNALETGQQRRPYQLSDFPDLPTLRAEFAHEQQAMQQYLDKLSDEVIGNPVTLRNWRGDPMQAPLWRILQHLILHGMQHHTELAQLLTAKGYSPGNIDFIFFEG
jgi:uncharacterized damage-inducible protein DinB